MCNLKCRTHILCTPQSSANTDSDSDNEDEEESDLEGDCTLCDHDSPNGSTLDPWILDQSLNYIIVC